MVKDQPVLGQIMVGLSKCQQTSQVMSKASHYQEGQQPRGEALGWTTAKAW